VEKEARLIAQEPERDMQDKLRAVRQAMTDALLAVTAEK
jgi:hypothetical protein